VCGCLAPLQWSGGGAEQRSGAGIIEKYCSPHGGQEVKRDREGPGKRFTLQSTPPVTYFLQPGFIQP
jgi:hypothetical protein